MRISSQLGDAVVLKELGGRISHARIERNLTQAMLAAEAGISKRTVERLESGEVGTQLSGLVRVCRVLGFLERLDSFIPEPTPSPIAQLKLQGRTRKRASHTKPTRNATTKWSWGESS
jgi:DNA-binding XRE family transcriptional regulator